MKTTLYVSGFNPKTRARNLAYEFERYGRLVRLDIPAPKNYAAKPYAFVEFEEGRDAEDAFQEMHGRTIEGYTLSIQWAKTNLMYSHIDRRPQPPYSQKSYNRNSRSRSPYRRDRSVSPPPPRYSSDEPPRRLRSRSRSPSSYQRRRSFSRSPPI